MKKKKLIKDIQRVILPENLVEEANNTCDAKLTDLNIITPLFYARALYLLNKKYDVVSFEYISFSRDKLQIILNMPKPYEPVTDRNITIQIDSKNLTSFDTENVLNKAQIFEYEPVIRNIINTAYLSATNDIVMIGAIHDKLLNIAQRNYRYYVYYKLFNIKPNMNEVAIKISGIGSIIITNRYTHIVPARDEVGIEQILSGIKNGIDNVLLEVSPFFKNERKKYRKMADDKKDSVINKNTETEKIYAKIKFFFIIDWFKKYIEGLEGGEVENIYDPSSGNLYLKFASTNHNDDINIRVSWLPANRTYEITDFVTGETILFDKLHECIMCSKSILKSKILKDFIINRLDSGIVSSVIC